MGWVDLDLRCSVQSRSAQAVGSHKGCPTAAGNASPSQPNQITRPAGTLCIVQPDHIYQIKLFFFCTLRRHFPNRHGGHLLLHDRHGPGGPPQRAPAAADDARPRHVAGLHRPRHVRLGHLGGLQGQPGTNREAPHRQGVGRGRRSHSGSELNVMNV